MADNIDLNEDLSLDMNDDEQQIKYLTFNIADEVYRISIGYVTEIIGVLKITILPDTPDYIKGIMNLRGKVIPVVDVRLRFGMDERAHDERTCIVVVGYKNFTIGLIVDSVAEVLDIPDDDVQSPPKVGQGSERKYIEGLGKIDDTVKILLNIHQLLFNEDEDVLSE